MTGALLSLLLTAGALAAADDQQPKRAIDISGVVNQADGKTVYAPGSGELTVSPKVWYVSTGRTLCEALSVSTERPATAGNGWRVEATLTSSATAKNESVVSVTWQRLWEGGQAVEREKGSRTLTIGAAYQRAPVTLDSIDGGGRLLVKQKIAALKTMAPIDLPLGDFPEIASDGELTALKEGREQLDATRRRLMTGEGLGASNPRIVELNGQMVSLHSRISARMAALIKQILQTLESGATPLPVVNGCDALSMSLSVAIDAQSKATEQVTETELWLVHRDPQGKETTQLQKVRNKVGGSNFAGGSGSFYFDDVTVSTTRGPVTVEVYGTVFSLAVEEGKVRTDLSISRRYSTTSSAYSWKSETGGVEYNTPVAQSEVVSFQLPPLTTDEGALVGHRFSLRLRTKILQ